MWEHHGHTVCTLSLFSLPPSVTLYYGCQQQDTKWLLYLEGKLLLTGRQKTSWLHWSCSCGKSDSWNHWGHNNCQTVLCIDLDWKRLVLLFQQGRFQSPCSCLTVCGTEREMIIYPNLVAPVVYLKCSHNAFHQIDRPVLHASHWDTHTRLGDYSSLKWQPTSFKGNSGLPLITLPA